MIGFVVEGNFKAYWTNTGANALLNSFILFSAVIQKTRCPKSIQRGRVSIFEIFLHGLDINLIVNLHGLGFLWNGSHSFEGAQPKESSLNGPLS